MERKEYRIVEMELIEIVANDIIVGSYPEAPEIPVEE